MICELPLWWDDMSFLLHFLLRLHSIFSHTTLMFLGCCWKGCLKEHLKTRLIFLSAVIQPCVDSTEERKREHTSPMSLLWVFIYFPLLNGFSLSVQSSAWQLHCSILEAIAPLLIRRDVCFCPNMWVPPLYSLSTLWLMITRLLAKTRSYRPNRMAPSVFLCMCASMTHACLCVLSLCTLP